MMAEGSRAPIASASISKVNDVSCFIVRSTNCLTSATLPGAARACGPWGGEGVRAAGAQPNAPHRRAESSV